MEEERNSEKDYFFIFPIFPSFSLPRGFRFGFENFIP